MKTLEQFLNELANRESGGNYRAFNKFGYAGKYQMGEMALVDCGYYQKKTRCFNNDWTGVFTGKDNVNSIQDFLSNPLAQENAMKIFIKKQWGYLKAVEADKFLGKTYNGYNITPSGLLAGAHLKGAGTVIKYLESGGAINSKDGFGTSVEEYLKRFAGYDVSEITGIK